MLTAVAALALGCGRQDVRPTNRGELALSVDGGAPLALVAHDFGAVARGQQRSVDVVATNVGRDALTVTRLALEGADAGSFFVRGALGTLQPGASSLATVTFAPAQAGAQAARLAFEHDAASARPVATLSGTGE